MVQRYIIPNVKKSIDVINFKQNMIKEMARCVMEAAGEISMKMGAC